MCCSRSHRWEEGKKGIKLTNIGVGQASLVGVGEKEEEKVAEN